MKKMAFYIVPLIIAIMGCASYKPVMVKANGGSFGIDLDAAIRAAATQMGENLSRGT